MFEKENNPVGGSVMQIYGANNKSALRKKQQRKYKHNKPDLNFGNSAAFTNMEDDEAQKMNDLNNTAPHASL